MTLIDHRSYIHNYTKLHYQNELLHVYNLVVEKREGLNKLSLLNETGYNFRD